MSDNSWMSLVQILKTGDQVGNALGGRQGSEYREAVKPAQFESWRHPEFRLAVATPMPAFLAAARRLLPSRSATKKYRTTPLRGLLRHPPYFHNGIAVTLDAVVELYDTKQGLDLTAQQKADLVEYLKSL